MKGKYLIFSEDKMLCRKLEDAFVNKDIIFKNPVDFPLISKGDNCKLILIDGDALPPQLHLNDLKKLKRKRIPVVYIFDNLGGKEAIEVLKHDVVSILFKDYSGTQIKKELKEIQFNFNYLEKVKDLAENDAKTKKFLNVVKTLTSTNSINDIMISILDTMKEVFKLESTVFFIVTGKRLKQKITLGKSLRNSTDAQWELDDAKIKWLQKIQINPTPLYITDNSPECYKKYFKKNTLLIPLVMKEKFSGIISTTFKSTSRILSKNEITLLNAFAEQTAVALENAQLYRDVIKTREALVDREKKNLLGQVILSLNHEINNPLSIISMEAQLLQQRLTNKEDKVEARLAKIEINIDRIKSILETISSLNIDDQITTEYIDGKQMLNLFNYNEH
ncbi:MAG: hypothetical protein GY757_27275 [bacterium]|nr:hypothetical protein [bacterium]